MKLTIFKLQISIFIILATVITSIFVLQAPLSYAQLNSGTSANLQTFSDRDSGVTINYRSTWSVINPFNKYLTGGATRVAWFTPDGGRTFLSILYYKNTIDSLQTMTNGFLKSGSREGRQLLHSEPVNLSGYPAYEASWQNPDGSRELSTWTKAGGNGYAIGYVADSSVYYNYLRDVQQMVGSLKITPPFPYTHP